MEQLISDTIDHLRGTVVVTNPNGLHLRPAMVFAKAAQRFTCNINVMMGERAANGKSPIDLLLLAAESGTELIVEVQGRDASSALPILLEILSAPMVEDLEIEPVPPAG